MSEDALRQEVFTRLSKLTDICRAIITRSIKLSANPRAVPAESTALAKYATRLNKPDTPVISMLNKFVDLFNEHRARILDYNAIHDYLIDPKSVTCWLSNIFNAKTIQVLFAPTAPQLGYIDLTKIYDRAAMIKTLAIKSLESNPDDVLIPNEDEDIIFFYRLYRVFESALELNDHPDKEMVSKIIERIREASLEDDTPAATSTSSSSVPLPAGFGDLGALFAKLSTGDLSGIKSMATQLGLKESTFDTVTTSAMKSIKAIENGEKIGDIIDSTVSALKEDPECQRYAEMATNLKDQLSKEAAPAPEVSTAVTEMIANDSNQ